MPKKIEEKLHILCTSRAYLAPAKVMGPIVHPLLVTKSVAVQLLMSGAEVFEYVPESKKTFKLTLGNINNPSRYDAIKEPAPEEIPVEPVERNGVPTIVTPISEPAPEEGETSTEAAPSADVVEEVVVANIVFTYNEDGTVDESGIIWNNYSKNQRKAIRARINEYNASMKG